MPSIDLNNFLFENPLKNPGDLLFWDLTSLRQFNDSFQALTFYHVERCEHDDCSQCLFSINLRYVYTEVIENKEGIDKLQSYCKIRKEQFICSRLFIYILADLKKRRLKLEKEFQ